MSRVHAEWCGLVDAHDGDCGPTQLTPGDTIGTVLDIKPPPARDARVVDLERHRPTLIAYLKMKLEAEDWHGVQDAASDLRDVDSELDGLRY